MIFQGKRISELTEGDMHSLVENAVPEGKLVDFKRDLPGLSDGERKEFLFDVSSFANASGGYLVNGIEEEGGIAKALTGLSVADADKETQKLQSIILAGIDPRIPGLELRFLSITGSKHILVISIPKSWTPPHMVTLGGADKFYTRNSSGKHRMDWGELRAAFTLSGNIAEQIRKFRNERISRILENETPVQLVQFSKTVLHVIPVQSFFQATRIHLGVAAHLHGGLLEPLNALRYEGSRVNLDGLLNFAFRLRGPEVESYLQLYGNGIIETVDAKTISANVNNPHFISTAKLIPHLSFEQGLIGQIPKYVTALERLGISPPIVIMVTLVGVKDYWMSMNPGQIAGAAIDRDVVVAPEIILEKMDCKPSDLRPILDAIWNAAGFIGSPRFDPAGNWNPNG
jgi:hypothetical protein